MRNLLPLLLLLAAVALGWWLLTAADDGPVSSLEDDGLGIDPGPEAAETPVLKAEGEKAAPKRTPAPKKHVVVDPRKLPKGTVLIRVLGPDLQPLPARDLRVFVEPGKGATWRTRLPIYDADANLWRADRVVAGTVRIKVQGDFIVGRTQEAAVRADAETTVDVNVDRAGSIRYDVIAYDKTRPKEVKLTLFDWQDKPVKAWYQERTSRRYTTPKFVASTKIGPEGVVFGLEPGRYRLKVVSSFEEWDEQKVDVVAGKEVKVSLEVRR